MKKLTKKDIQKRILQENGEPLPLSKFKYNSKTKTIDVGQHNELVFNFQSMHGYTFSNVGPDCTFRTGSDCTFDTGSGCTFDTSYGCTFRTGPVCTFRTGPGCMFHTGPNCTFDTGSGCTFDTSYGCTFDTSYGCTFDTSYGCTFDTSYGCTFDTGPGCMFHTGSDCTFDTGSGCMFHTGPNCTFDTSYGCMFHTGPGCTFDTGPNCTFDTSYGCTFRTGSDCKFRTGPGCTFDTGPNCTFDTGSGCTFDTGKNSVIVARNPETNHIINYDDMQQDTIKTLPSGLLGHLAGPYLNGDPQFGEFVIADGILSEVVKKKKGDMFTVYQVYNIQLQEQLSELVENPAAFHLERESTYLILQDDGAAAHGGTLQEARDSLTYKIGSRDTSMYEDLTLSSKVSFEKAVQMYRAITGACESGVRGFVSLQEEVKDEYTVQELIDITTGQYGAEEFQQFFKK